MSDFQILKIQPDDWNTLLEIATIDQESFGKDGLTPANLSLMARAGRIYALREGSIISTEAIVLASFPTGNSFLFSLAVLENFRHKGHGKKLMKAICEDLAEEGVKTMELTVAPENQAAINLYCMHFQFEKIAFIENHFGPGQHRLLLRKTLYKDEQGK